MSRKHVPFQKLRLMWFQAQQNARADSETDPARKRAYEELSRLSEDCIYAVNHGKQDLMMQKLELLGSNQFKKDFEDLLSGKHPDLPEWLRKDK